MLLLLLFLSSCAALTKSQKKAVDEFAESSKEFSAAPKKFLQSVNECFYKYGKLEAATTDDVNRRLNHLDNIINRYNRWDNFIEKYNTSYLLIEKYGKALQSFANIDVEKDVNENAASMGNAIDTLIKRSSERKINTIPLGFGNLAAKIIQKAGNRYIRKRQKEDLIAFLTIGDVLVDSIHIVLKELVAETLVFGKLNEVDTNSRKLYLAYLNELEPAEKNNCPILRKME